MSKDPSEEFFKANLVVVGAVLALASVFQGVAGAGREDRPKPADPRISAIVDASNLGASNENAATFFQKHGLFTAEEAARFGACRDKYWNAPDTQTANAANISVCMTPYPIARFKTSP